MSTTPENLYESAEVIVRMTKPDGGVDELTIHRIVFDPYSLDDAINFAVEQPDPPRSTFLKQMPPVQRPIVELRIKGRAHPPIDAHDPLWTFKTTPNQETT